MNKFFTRQLSVTFEQSATRGLNKVDVGILVFNLRFLVATIIIMMSIMVLVAIPTATAAGTIIAAERMLVA